ncbi:hypothetical protein AKJ09_10625 [Labilithrix luteola]|uniref:Uncharacterized protein n=1 Tax=Labilithrix luteola TaxID=1391654 RepID=A0A0K1QE68_9BACT|nr:hypothetical protein [Labilithrix luteola]AKV03962.1 hypothetical protein AKJ09_10625 [Labilithrix luteola]
MRESVRKNFVAFTKPLEGVLPFLYLDAKCLVTIAIGNLVDPIEYALELPLEHPDGRRATRDEIAVAWVKVKARKDLAWKGGMAYASVTSLRLSPTNVERVVFGKLDELDRRLSARFPAYVNWSADAQLGVLSLAWACGPAFHFPRFEAACRALDFDTAAAEGKIANEHGTIRTRNAANRTLFRNAAHVRRARLDPAVLYYPVDLQRERADEVTTEAGGPASSGPVA